MRRFIPILFIFIVIAAFLSMEGCNKYDRSEVQQTSNLSIDVPSNFPQPNEIFKDNPITKEGFALGRNSMMDGWQKTALHPALPAISSLRLSQH
jgi:hypothetical protein